ncbi:MAG: MFS transporter [Ignavibacteria bacterium]|nr:MFS transporter [Ignavibacteria bacterium]MBT8382831.1 MFS transporter [Ignavibacteria bacterium]MBT8390431.1 MFS transporter [Ignavibacteria bacterium]NNJ51968.1 MFS transporter [Ignavibacteriaceae bacterium]NNL20764.1 MFS transporter [Ignavibacteriaceae bacterium]
MKNRTTFPRVFWVANTIEVLERFAYYGIYMGFGIYLQQLGFSKGDLGVIQSIFLALSYLIPLFSGTFADRYGFKKVLIVSYLAYLPSILLLIFTKSFSGIAITMLSIGFAAGIFKPLISGTVRVTTDKTNKTLGFGIFYAMVNVGASFGPIIMGKLRAISWDYVFITAAVAVGVMFIITLIFYKEPPREFEGVTLKKKFKDMGEVLSDIKFLIFIILLGVFFWMPFWAFFNILAVYINDYMNTAALYQGVQSIVGSGIASIISSNESGVWRINAEAISHTGYIIIIFQLFISRIFEKRSAIPSFLFGLFIAALGFIVLGLSVTTVNGLVFLGIFLFAIGEMISSPRIQEYITWIAPKEKAGLYMGTNFLATFIGATLSGVYTGIMGAFEAAGTPEYIMHTLAAHSILGIIAIALFTKITGAFTELEH